MEKETKQINVHEDKKLLELTDKLRDYCVANNITFMFFASGDYENYTTMMSGNEAMLVDAIDILTVDFGKAHKTKGTLN